MELTTHFDTSFLAGQVKEKSARMYERDFRVYLAYAGEHALNPASFARWRAVLVDEGKSPYTVNRMLSSVRSIMEKAAEQGYIARNVAEEFDRVKGLKPEALVERTREDVEITPEQMRVITSKPNTDTLKGMRDAALLHTLASTGVRVSELVAMKLSDIRGKTGAYFMMVAGKNQLKPLPVPLSDEAHTAIERWVNARPFTCDPIFTSFQGRGNRMVDLPMSTVGAWGVIKKYAGEMYWPHLFRKFVGTQLAEKNVMYAQEVLRHKDIKTTMNHYVRKRARAGVTNTLY